MVAQESTLLHQAQKAEADKNLKVSLPKIAADVIEHALRTSSDVANLEKLATLDNTREIAVEAHSNKIAQVDRVLPPLPISVLEEAKTKPELVTSLRINPPRKTKVPTITEKTVEQLNPKKVLSKDRPKIITTNATQKLENSEVDSNIEDIFQAHEPELGEVTVDQELIDEINTIDDKAIVAEVTSQQQPSNETVPTLDAVVLRGSEAPIHELAPAPDNTAESVELPAPVMEVIEFTSLLGLPESPAATDPETLTILADIEIVPLPPVCVEVMTEIKELTTTDPEVAEEATTLLESISLQIDEVTKLRMDGSEDAPAAEQELQKLCVELFTKLNKEVTPEKIMEFIQGIMQAKQMAQVIADRKAPTTEQGTHEIKDEHDLIFGGLIQEIEDYLARAIGTHALRNLERQTT